MHTLTVAFSTQLGKTFIQRYSRHIQRTCGVKNLEIISLYNPGTYSLAEAYQQLINRASSKMVCLIHHDLKFLQKGWGRQVIHYFLQNPEYGLLSPAGSLSLAEHGVYWLPREHMIGRITHRFESPSGSVLKQSNYSGSFPGVILPAQVLDGLFLALHKERLAVDFDLDLKGYHFYDIALSLTHHLKGGKQGVMTDLKLCHSSGGNPTPDFHEVRQQFLHKYHSVLPQSMSPNILVPQIGGRVKHNKVAVLCHGNLTLNGFGKAFEGCSHITFYLPENGGGFLSGSKVYLPTPHKGLAQLWPYFLKALSKDCEYVFILDGACQAQNAMLKQCIQVYQRGHSQGLGILGARLHLPDGFVFCQGFGIAHYQNQWVLQHHGLYSAYAYTLESQPVMGNPSQALFFHRNLLKVLPQALSFEGLPGLELSLAALKAGYQNLALGKAVGIVPPPDLSPVADYHLSQWLVRTLTKAVKYPQIARWIPNE